jgi:hypothetical protein
MTTVKVIARAVEVGLVKARARAMEKVVQVGEGAAAARGVAVAGAVEGVVERNLNSTRKICTWVVKTKTEMAEGEVAVLVVVDQLTPAPSHMITSWCNVRWRLPRRQWLRSSGVTT